MKILRITLVFLLILLLSWQECRINDLKMQVRSQDDSIQNYHFQTLSKLEKNELMKRILNKANESAYLDSNDSIVEVHRIKQQAGDRIRLVKVECFKDSSIRLIYKVISARNPLSGVGIDSLYYTHIQKLDKSVWLQFKDKLSKISSYDLTYWDGYLDCFGGKLTWEAAIRHKTYGFSTYCLQAPQFTEACEFLLRQVEDKEMQAMFKEQDKMRHEIK